MLSSLLGLVGIVLFVLATVLCDNLYDEGHTPILNRVEMEEMYTKIKIVGAIFFCIAAILNLAG